MARSPIRKVKSVPIRRRLLGTKDNQSQRAVQRRSRCLKRKAPAGVGVEIHQKAAILTGLGGMVAILLLVFAAYGVCRSEKILEALFDFTKYLATIVILWAAGPKVGNLLARMAKAFTKTEEK
jgi:hypothetical protein